MNAIEEIQKGNVKAFTLVYDQYHVKLYNYFLKKSKDTETAKELVQLSFIKLWRSRHTISTTYTADHQLFVIARTTFIDHIRHQAANKNQSVYLDEEAFINSLQTAPDMAFEDADYFNTAIQSLPPVRKKIFIMSRSNGLNYKEIAREMSISINTVEDHMSKAIRQLKALTSFFF